MTSKQQSVQDVVDKVVESLAGEVLQRTGVNSPRSEERKNDRPIKTAPVNKKKLYPTDSIPSAGALSPAEYAAKHLGGRPPYMAGDEKRLDFESIEITRRTFFIDFAEALGIWPLAYGYDDINFIEAIRMEFFRRKGECYRR